MKTLTVLSAAVLAVSIGLAQAQNPGAGTTGQSRTQCWDLATNTVKNQAPGSSMDAAKSGGTVGSAASGGATSSPSTSGSAASGGSPSGSPGQSAAQRPAGMPSC